MAPAAAASPRVAGRRYPAGAHTVAVSAAYRLPRGDVVGVQPSRANNVCSKGVSGQAAAYRCEAPGLLDFVAARACAHRELTRRTCLSGIGLRRAASCATWPRNQTRREVGALTDRLADATRPPGHHFARASPALTPALSREREQVNPDTPLPRAFGRDDGD